MLTNDLEEVHWCWCRVCRGLWCFNLVLRRIPTVAFVNKQSCLYPEQKRPTSPPKSPISPQKRPTQEGSIIPTHGPLLWTHRTFWSIHSEDQQRALPFQPVLSCTPPKSPMYPQKRPVYPQKSPIHPQKSPTYLQNRSNEIPEP